MEKLSKFPAFAVLLGLACVTFLRAQPLPYERQPEADHVKWVATCLEDFECIKAGMTRGEVESRMPFDGGIHSAGLVRFTHPDCLMFKVDVEFEFKLDPADQNRAVTSKDDKVTKVSKPYIARGSID